MAQNRTYYRNRSNFLEKITIVLVVFFYYCDFILYIGYINEGGIFNQKNITLGLFVPLFLVLLVKRDINLATLLRKPIIKWTVIYFLISIFAFIYSLIFDLGSEYSFDAFRTIIFSVIIIFLITSFLENQARFRLTRKCVVLGMLFSVFMNIAGFMKLIPLSKSLGRAAGFYINPNSAGISLCFGLVLVTKMVPSRWRTIFVLVVGIGIVLTFSRAAMLFYAIYLLYYIFILKTLSRNKKIVSVLCAALILGIFSTKIMNLFEAQEALNNNVMQRVAVMSDPLQNQNDITEDARIGILKIGFENYMSRPILGSGLGSSREILYQGDRKGPHNQVLSFLLDFGVIGVFLLFYYFYILKRNLVKERKLEFRNYIFTLLFFSFFSHSLFEEYSMLFIHAFAWVLLTSSASMQADIKTQYNTISQMSAEPVYL